MDVALVYGSGRALIYAHAGVFAQVSWQNLRLYLFVLLVVQ